jgi:hypothetical protein
MNGSTGSSSNNSKLRAGTCRTVTMQDGEATLGNEEGSHGPARVRLPRAASSTKRKIKLQEMEITSSEDEDEKERPPTPKRKSKTFLKPAEPKPSTTQVVNGKTVRLKEMEITSSEEDDGIIEGTRSYGLIMKLFKLKEFMAVQANYSFLFKL